MRKFMCAVIVTVCAVGWAMADSQQVVISDIKDGKVTYKVTEKGKVPEDAKEMTAKLAPDAKVYKGKGTFDKETKTFKVEKTGEALEKDAVMTHVTKAAESKAKGARAQIEIKDGTISEIIFIGGKKKKKTDAN